MILDPLFPLPINYLLQMRTMPVKIIMTKEIRSRNTVNQIIIRAIGISILFLTTFSTYGANARIDARNAYHMMEESSFDREVFSNSLKLIEAAYNLDPNEPWVYIAYSLAVMQQGYKIGTWYHHSSYIDGAVDKALELAIKANELGKNESQSYSHLARIYIIKTEYRKAWGLLNQAYQLDNKNYYAWFYKALIGYYMKDYKQATSNLDEAENNIAHKYQIKLVTRQRQRIAKKLGDKNLEEKMYRKNINDFPNNAYMYGNYGAFLYKNKRYNEAVKYYNKAISIDPYPNAVKWLEKSKIKAGVK